MLLSTSAKSDADDAKQEAAELRADLAQEPIIERNTRYKYSNHAFGLIGLAIESVTGERYTTWIKREIVDAAGLEETIVAAVRRTAAEA